MMPRGERVTMIDRPRRPDWLPAQSEIVRALGSHQRLYRFRKPRYQVQLLEDLAALLPGGDCRILDVGAGSGVVAELIASSFPGKSVVAVDVTNRVLPTVNVPFRTFDGHTLPFGDNSFDGALLCNVLHHVKSDARRGLLTEILRVTGGGPIVIKDHVARSGLDRLKLACLDFAGNAPFGGMVEASYLTAADWNRLLAELQCTGEMLPRSRYRGGVFAVMFPNGLEVCFRITAAAGR